MFQIGYAQEIITPPVGVGLAGYFNYRPNQGMYDDLMAKAIVMESRGKRFGFLTLELCSISAELFRELEDRIVARFGRELFDSLIISATHTHTGPFFSPAADVRNGSRPMAEDERTLYAFRQVADGAMRALERAVMNLLPGELEVGSVYNNPYGFVRRYWMKNGKIVTNPGWRNREIDKPECDYDRTIGILAVRQGGRLAALVCNIANHGDTIGGDLVSADWYGRFTQEIQHAVGSGLPVMILDDASGNINHFDFHQDVCQTSYAEATRIGRGYARIVLDQLDRLTPLEEQDVVVRNRMVEVPHRRLTPEEIAAAKHILETVPDIPKEGDFESQDLANGVPAALRYFAKRALLCQEKSVPSHSVRLTSIKLGNEIAFVSLPGEPFNGIGEAIRQKSPCKYTFVIELAQSVSGYVPMPECFDRGGYEVQPDVNSAGRDAATVLIESSIANL